MTTHEAGQDARVETVARAIAEADYENVGKGYPWAEMDEGERDIYRALAVAALAAMHPADETLRERLEALAARWESLDLGVGLYPEDSAHRSAHEDRAEACAEDLRAVLGGEL